LKDHIYDIYRDKKLTAKFGIIGGIGFICNYSVLKFATGVWSFNRIIAEILGALVALQVTFLLHDRWTYRIDKAVHKYHLTTVKRYRMYLFSNSFGALLTVVLFSIFSIFAGHLLALAMAALIGLLWNFLANKGFVWSHKPHNSVTE
jgi:putative flippase GtrA